MLVHVINTAALDAIGAAGTVLSPVDAAELADAMEPPLSWNCVDMIAIRHLRISF
jgi:hypothetical protein